MHEFKSIRMRAPKEILDKIKAKILSKSYSNDYISMMLNIMNISHEKMAIMNILDGSLSSYNEACLDNLKSELAGCDLTDEEFEQISNFFKSPLYDKLSKIYDKTVADLVNLHKNFTAKLTTFAKEAIRTSLPTIIKDMGTIVEQKNKIDLEKDAPLPETVKIEKVETVSDQFMAWGD